MTELDEQRAIALYTQFFTEVESESEETNSTLLATATHDGGGGLRAIADGYEIHELSRSIFTTPLSLAAFKNKLQHISTEQGTVNAKRLFGYGVKLLVEVTLFGVAKKPIEEVRKNTTTATHIDDDEDGDITAQRGRPSVDVISRRKSNNNIVMHDDDSDGDDLTTLKGAVADNEFISLDDELRFELVCNILRILQCYFVYLDGSFFDFLINEQDRDLLVRLLKNCEFYLHKMVETIESSEENSFPNLGVVKELIYLVYYIIITYLYEYLQFLNLESLSEPQSANDVGDIVESFGQRQNNDDEEDQNEGNLEFLFLFNLFPPLINRILSITDFKPPKLTLLLKTLTKLYTINFLTDYLTKTKRHLFRGSIPYKSDIESQIPYKLIPILLMDFNYYYGYQPDLMIHQLSSKSFFHWLTGNRFSGNAYLKYQTSNYITSLYENLDLSLFGDFNKDSFLKELQTIQIRRLRRDTLSDPKELVSIFLMIFLNPESLIRSKNLTDMQNDEDHIDFLDLWLCLSSYIVQYQHKSSFLQLLTRIILSTLHNLVKNYEDEVYNLTINEAKWKLCHQKAPFIPLNNDNQWIVPFGKYLCDILQVMLRFNLNNKFNVENYRLTLDLLYKLILSDKLASSTYNFVELGKSIFIVLDFISKKHNSVIRYAILEDLLLNLDLILWKSKFEDSHLLYEFLHKKQMLFGLMTESDINPPHIESLIQFFDGNIKLEDIKDEAEAEDLIVKLVDGDKELSKSLLGELNYSYKFKDTCMYVEGEIGALELMVEIMEYMNNMKNIEPW
ncbi:uncharacterized protein KQ657_003193 [Scheffersomyces spartinae]|uniref:Uncharacterized protein n=1 Tax=Scheffersomyces spartinae TaxID=45513 RepID=A0A9P7VC80_9ASCO|nr:uncharacterized protein KQ657_003193 [Scheffersomyces spartinae]KAG7195433.1 hypothetical protein KQ657_003193 [Scheffersomyces spartinae]